MTASLGRLAIAYNTAQLARLYMNHYNNQMKLELPSTRRSYIPFRAIQAEVQARHWRGISLILIWHRRSFTDMRDITRLMPHQPLL